jgi:hypothetical protein
MAVGLAAAARAGLGDGLPLKGVGELLCALLTSPRLRAARDVVLTISS